MRRDRSTAQCHESNGKDKYFLTIVSYAMLHVQTTRTPNGLAYTPRVSEHSYTRSR